MSEVSTNSLLVQALGAFSASKAILPFGSFGNHLVDYDMMFGGSTYHLRWWRARIRASIGFDQGVMVIMIRVYERASFDRADRLCAFETEHLFLARDKDGTLFWFFQRSRFVPSDRRPICSDFDCEHSEIVNLYDASDYAEYEKTLPLGFEGGFWIQFADLMQASVRKAEDRITRLKHVQTDCLVRSSPAKAGK